MDVINYILKQRKMGRGVKLCRDCYGNHWAEMGAAWLLGRASQIELSREQFDVLRHGLKRATRGGDGYRPAFSFSSFVNRFAALL